MSEDEVRKLAEKERLIDQMAREWPDHYARAKLAMRQVEQLHVNLNEMKNDTAHLEKLHVLIEIKDKLLDTATGRKQIPLVSHIIGMVLLGTIFLVMLVVNNSKEVKIPWLGIEITGGGGAK